MFRNDPSNPVSTNYSEIHVLKTKKLIDEFTGGNALFTQPSSPINCASTAQKVMYLAEESIKNKKYQTKSTFTFHSGQSLLFPVEKYANALSKICTARDITVFT